MIDIPPKKYKRIYSKLIYAANASGVNIGSVDFPDGSVVVGYDVHARTGAMVTHLDYWTGQLSTTPAMVNSNDARTLIGTFGTETHFVTSGAHNPVINDDKMFPEGHGIEISRDEKVYLNSEQSSGETATIWANIYYVIPKDN